MVVPWTLSEPTPVVCRCSTSAGSRGRIHGRSWSAPSWPAGWRDRRGIHITTCSGTSGSSSSTIPTSSSVCRACPNPSASTTSCGSWARPRACRSTRWRPRDRPTSTRLPWWTRASGWGSVWRAPRAVASGCCSPPGTPATSIRCTAQSPSSRRPAAPRSSDRPTARPGSTITPARSGRSPTTARSAWSRTGSGRGTPTGRRRCVGCWPTNDRIS